MAVPPISKKDESYLLKETYLEKIDLTRDKEAAEREIEIKKKDLATNMTQKEAIQQSISSAAAKGGIVRQPQRPIPTHGDASKHRLDVKGQPQIRMVTTKLTQMQVANPSAMSASKLQSSTPGSNLGHSSNNIQKDGSTSGLMGQSKEIGTRGSMEMGATMFQQTHIEQTGGENGKQERDEDSVYHKMGQDIFMIGKSDRYKGYEEDKNQVRGTQITLHFMEEIGTCEPNFVSEVIEQLMSSVDSLGQTLVKNMNDMWKFYYFTTKCMKSISLRMYREDGLNEVNESFFKMAQKLPKDRLYSVEEVLEIFRAWTERKEEKEDNSKLLVLEAIAKISQMIEDNEEKKHEFPLDEVKNHFKMMTGRLSDEDKQSRFRNLRECVDYFRQMTAKLTSEDKNNRLQSLFQSYVFDMVMVLIKTAQLSSVRDLFIPLLLVFYPQNPNSLHECIVFIKEKVGNLDLFLQLMSIFVEEQKFDSENKILLNDFKYYSKMGFFASKSCMRSACLRIMLFIAKWDSEWVEQQIEPNMESLTFASWWEHRALIICILAQILKNRASQEQDRIALYKKQNPISSKSYIPENDSYVKQVDKWASLLVEVAKRTPDPNVNRVALAKTVGLLSESKKLVELLVTILLEGRKETRDWLFNPNLQSTDNTDYYFFENDKSFKYDLSLDPSLLNPHALYILTCLSDFVGSFSLLLISPFDVEAACEHSRRGIRGETRGFDSLLLVPGHQLPKREQRTCRPSHQQHRASFGLRDERRVSLHGSQ